MFADELFIETLLIKANPDIDDSALDLLIEDVKPVLYDWVMTNLVSKLPENKLQEFVDMTKKEYSNEDIQKFLHNTIPNYDDFIAKVYDDFQKMYLENCKEFDESEENK